ncbi:MAG: sulfatase-like hydrolase/transferase [Anaerolineae bacterium]
MSDSVDRPNVLIFCVDEMRADHMGCAGNPVVQTPNLDRLAERGTLFRRSYCNNPICMPARATMFTGLLPRDHGVRVNGQALRTDLPIIELQHQS